MHACKLGPEQKCNISTGIDTKTPGGLLLPWQEFGANFGDEAPLQCCGHEAVRASLS